MLIEVVPHELGDEEEEEGDLDREDDPVEEHHPDEALVDPDQRLRVSHFRRHVEEPQRRHAHEEDEDGDEREPRDEVPRDGNLLLRFFLLFFLVGDAVGVEGHVVEDLLQLAHVREALVFGRLGDASLELRPRVVVRDRVDGVAPLLGLLDLPSRDVLDVALEDDVVRRPAPVPEEPHLEHLHEVPRAPRLPVLAVRDACVVATFRTEGGECARGWGPGVPTNRRPRDRWLRP